MKRITKTTLVLSAALTWTAFGQPAIEPFALPPIPDLAEGWTQLAQGGAAGLQEGAVRPRAGGAGGGLRGMKNRGGANKQIRTLIVSQRLADPKSISEAEEDLAVMSRLLAKVVEKENEGDAGKAMGITITSWSSDTKAPEAIYLEGHGALFTLNVNFPLMPAAEEKEDKKAEAAPDSEWDKARQELFGGANLPEQVQMWVNGMNMGGRAPVYDPDKVNALKRAILEALRSAGNIRALKPNDYVTVAVLSYPNRWGGNSFFSGNVSIAIAGAGDDRVVTKSVDSSTDTARQSTLTIRVTRGDADAFAQGKLTLEEFQKKAVITTY